MPSSFEIIQLQGGIVKLGEYYLHVYINPNNQKFRLQVDTGSSSLILVGDNCQNCTSKSIYHYNERDVVPCDQCEQCFEGSTDSCGFEIHYGYGLQAGGIVVQTQAQMLKENLNSNIKNVYVYVIQKEVGTWPKKVDGILGMAFPALNCNPTCFVPAWNLLAPKNAIGFNVCFGDVGGQLQFYEKFDVSKAGKEYLRLPILSKFGKKYYSIASHGLGVMERSTSEKETYILFSRKHVQEIAVIDTGTTLLIVPQHVYSAFTDYMQHFYCNLEGICESPSILDPPVNNQALCLVDSPYETFPTLVISLGEDGLIMIPPQLYFIRYEKGVYCLAIQPGPGFIIGDAILRGFTVSFDADFVTFSTEKHSGCGSVYGLPSSKNLIREHVKEFSYSHETIKFDFFSWFVFGILLFLSATCWRRYMRRRLGYTALQ